ncbi:uncharacterized protein LOC129717716 isoform X2 [Wyeomyia smithii]|uniref:uncharacterized protein LOC129717716 isoform X2 n=1 Tax=Wyeomyia smithii TaxID=174621 RepID=UPI00246811E5|nr:uncharacterized protein LOC129717716 isoform X2 [Wyeomyia smithii]
MEITCVKIYFIIFLRYTSINGLHRFDPAFTAIMMDKGKLHLKELEQKTQLPKYGDCWLHSLAHLRSGCAMLTDLIQMDLALHFTDCFLEMSGQDRLDCLSERTEPLKRLCMSEMSDRAFAVYTEFFTQTQNMCFFLQGQHWQREADKTIHRLSVKSQEVSEQLEIAGKVQQVVLDRQKQGLKLQSKILEIGENVTNTLNVSQNKLDNITLSLIHSAEKHQAVLAELFKEFHLLHNWIECS